MGTKKINAYTRSACADSSNNIYVSGNFSKIDTTYFWGIAKWDGTKWDSLGSACYIPGQSLTSSNGARTLAFYKNELYAGGFMTYVGGKPIKYLAKWNGTQWDSLPESPNGGVVKLIVLNGKLYVFGSFNKVGTMNCYKIAVWDGINWSTLAIPYTIADLTDVTEYNGELYFGGNMDDGSSTANLIKYDGVNWSVVGNGITGSFSWVNSLKVFNNELYVGGYFLKSAGNAGDFLCKWDGLNFKEVVSGLNGQVWNIINVPDGLIASGCFGTPIFKSVLKLSNAGACGYSNLFHICLEGSLYVNNKLYFYGNYDWVDNDSSLAYISYVNYTTQTDTCIAMLNGLNDLSNLNTVKLYPNPTNSIINIVDEGRNELQNTKIEITNTLGEIVFSNSFNNQIDISHLRQGIYFLSVQNDSYKKTVKIVKE